ncbi:MAG: HAMP domain-containing histidine kinase [Deltaproteobacteria bacterium]|nr:HAMP domain-containing histidine kinase [Deltaproteobacteria bacterium]
MQRFAQEVRGISAESALRRVGDALSDALVGTRAGRIVWASARLAELAGHEDSASLLGLPFAALFEDADDGILDATDGYGAECLVRREEGPPARVTVRRICGGEDGGADEVWLLADVTRQRLLESELLRAGRDLHAANREIATLRERVRRELADREELLTAVSHELRTPVTVIVGYARLLLSEKVGALNADQKRFLAETQKSCQRLDAFIGELLEAARSLTETAVLEVSELPVGTVIESVASALVPLLDERKLALRIAPEAAVVYARFDPARVEQVLTNLVGNAIKFAPSGSTIEIGARRLREGDREVVEVAVADAGPGVPETDRERIFEPWVRAGEGCRRGGVGLGLAIARRIVSAHGGKITVAPRAGGGSVFRFTLPAASPAGPEAA